MGRIDDTTETPAASHHLAGEAACPVDLTPER